MAKQKRIIHTKAVREEPDPAWRNWFMEVEQRRKRLADPQNKPWVVSRYDKDGDTGEIIRRKSEPVKAAKLVKKNSKERTATVNTELIAVHSAWNQAAGPEIASVSDVYSFKNGVLTISVHSSILLQEIRQFRKEELLEALRQCWSASVPLLRVQYRTGVRNG